MARRRAGTSRSVQRRRSPNYSIVRTGARGVRRLAKSVVGQPGVPLLPRGTNSYRSIRTLMKNDPSKGIQQPEARQALLTNRSIVAQGVSVDGGGKRARGLIMSKSKVTAPIAGLTRVRPPRLGPLKRRGNAT